MTNKKNHTFNIILAPDLFASLTHIASVNQMSRAHYLRTILRQAIFMTEHHEPICADGGRCVAPHLHPSRHAISQTPPR